MIKSFKCKQTKSIYEGNNPKKFSAFRAIAERKLQMLDDAVELKDLRSPPGNKLEKLSGDRQGQYSIRINQQWRICFRWGDEFRGKKSRSSEPCEVEICDYH